MSSENYQLESNKRLSQASNTAYANLMGGERGDETPVMEPSLRDRREASDSISCSVNDHLVPCLVVDGGPMSENFLFLVTESSSQTDSRKSEVRVFVSGLLLQVVMIMVA